MNRLKIILSSLVLGAVLVGFVSESFAQDFQQPYKRFEIGAFGTGGLSIFQGNVPDGAKTDIQAAYTFAALASYMVDPQFGFALGVGYEKRGAYFHKESKTDPNETYTLNYISIQPSIRFKSFLLGVNIGMPASGTNKYNPSSTSTIVGDVSTERDFKDSMSTNIDIRASGLLPIVENDNGNLYFLIQASYSVSDALGKNGFIIPFQTDPSLVNKKSTIPTVQIGLSYLLSPGGKK